MNVSEMTENDIQFAMIGVNNVWLCITCSSNCY